MRDNLIEMGAQGALLILYGLGTLVVGALGAVIEYQSYLRILAGEYPLAAWLAVIGAVTLFFAYLIFQDKFLATLGKETATDAEITSEG